MNKTLIAALIWTGLVFSSIGAHAFGNSGGSVGAAGMCQFRFSGQVGERSWQLADAAHQECRLNEELKDSGRQSEMRYDAYRMWKEDQPQKIQIQPAPIYMR